MASVLRLMERQLESWNIKQRLEELTRPGRCIEGGVGYGPCLLVSRECGSGGSRIARLTAERLGWQVYDREILDQIAKLAHVRRQLLSTVDEKTRQAWGEEGRQPELKPEDIGYDLYLRYLRQVVLALGHHGEVVLVGRGAHYLLPSRCSLRVRVVAPVESRLRRVMQSDGRTPEEAQRYIAAFDQERNAFVRQSFQSEAGSAVNYDLVMNTAEMSLETAVETVLIALKHKLGLPTQRWPA